MSGENLVHVKLEYQESLEAKKSILYTEAGILKMDESIKRFHELKEEEIGIKMALYKKARLFTSSLTALKSFLPSPVVLKIPGEAEKIRKIEGKKAEYHADVSGIESQLREINERLSKIKSRG